ncbi:hypothetical protein [Mycoplasma sp. VS1572C]
MKTAKSNSVIFFYFKNKYKELEKNILYRTKAQELCISDIRNVLETLNLKAIRDNEYKEPELSDNKSNFYDYQYYEILENLPIVQKINRYFQDEEFDTFLHIFHFYLNEEYVQDIDKLDFSKIKLNPECEYIPSDTKINRVNSHFEFDGTKYVLSEDSTYEYLASIPDFFNNDEHKKYVVLDSLNRPRYVIDLPNYYRDPNKLVVAKFSKNIFDFLKENNNSFCLVLDDLNQIKKNLKTLAKRVSHNCLKQMKTKKYKRPFLVTKQIVGDNKYYIYGYFIDTNKISMMKSVELLKQFLYESDINDYLFDIFQKDYMQFFITNTKLNLDKSTNLIMHASRLQQDEFLFNKAVFTTQNLTKNISVSSKKLLGYYLLLDLCCLNDIHERISYIMERRFEIKNTLNLLDLIHILKINEVMYKFENVSLEIHPSKMNEKNGIWLNNFYWELLVSIIKNN